MRPGLLLDAMANDAYPAIRHLAARSLGRLLPAAEPGLAAYDPNEDRARERHAAVDRVRAALRATAVTAAAPVAVRALRAASVAAAIEIGE